MQTNDLGRALVLFLGFGTAPMPQADRDAVVAEFGSERGDELAACVSAVVLELSQFEVDWSLHSLQAAGKLARDEIQRRHPELSDEALRAIEWKFTYDWR